MRPIIRLLAAAVAAAATIQSCSTLTGYPTDAEASYAKAIELTKKSVDTDKFKIYSLSIMEGETLSDNLFLVTVKLVNKDDQAFSQSYYMNGLEPTDLRDVQSTFEAPEYETTVGIDLSERSVTWRDQVVELSSGEYNLLVVLARHAGEVLSRDQILQRLRGIEFNGTDRSVDVAISKLRRKFDDCAGEARKIKTVWGKGYLFSRSEWEC